MAGDDDVIDSAVVRVGPDLSGFRRKLERELKTQIAGIGVEIPVKLNESKAREGLNYVAGLRTKYIKEQLNRTRDANEKVQQAADQARQHELKQERSFQETLDRLHRRAETHEAQRVRSASEKLAQQREQAAEAEARRELTQVRSLAEKVEKARSDAQRAEQEREGRRIRSVAEKLAREQGDAERADREREAKRTRSAAEALEKQIADAILADREREARRVRTIEESLQRTRGQAQEADLARQRQKYRNHQEYMDALHVAALNHELSEEEKASAKREKIRSADVARRKKTFADMRKADKFIDYGGRGVKPMNLLYGIVTAMTPALFAMGTSAVQAASGIAALGSAGIGAALGLSAVVIGFQGIGDALSLRKQVMNEETTKAANSAQGAVQAADDLAQSKRTLADAQRDEAQAQKDVHTARQEAIRDLQDLRQAVIDLDNQYKSDVISVAEAKQNMVATDQNFFATALDRARARQDYQDARTRLSDTALERKQKKDDLKTSLSKGIEGSDKVRDARERVRDARDRRLDAQDSLRKGATRTAGGIDKTSSAAAQLKKKIAEMSPAAQEMYYWFDKNEKLFKSLQRQISQKTLPGFNTFLKAITDTPKGGKSTLQLAADYAGDLGAIIGKYAGKLGEWTKTPFFRSSMAKIQESNAKAFDKLGQALLNLADPITRILVNAAPGFESLSDTLLDLSKRFSAWIKKLDESGALKKWFEDSRTEMGKWWRIGKNILTIIKNLFTAANPAGGSLVSQFEKFTKYVADLSGSKEGRTWLINFFDKIQNLPYADIIDFFKNAVVFFAAFRFFKFLKGLNPFLTLVAALAAADPEGAAKTFGQISRFIGSIMDKLVEHPKATASLLTILALAKAGKAIGFDIKIPAMNGIRNALTSKFKVLDKFVGGGATTGTMTVHAGVVNVYGKGAVDAPGRGKPGKPGAPAAAGGGLLTGAAIAAVVAAVFADQQFQRAQKGEGFADPFKQFANNPGIGTGLNTLQMASPIGWLAYGLGQAKSKKFFGVTLPDWIGAGLVARFPKLLALKAPRLAAERAMGQEGNAFKRLRSDLDATGGFDNPVAQASLEAYIAKRKQSVSAYVAWVKSAQGPVAAAEAQRIEDEKSKTALENLMTQYGYTQEAAEDYAEKAYAVGRETNIATGYVKGFNDKLGILSERLNDVTGTKQIVLTIDGEEKVFRSLESAAAYQQTIRQGIAPTQSNLNKQKKIFQKNMAQGGRVTGYSPHDEADNIPAMLTADEWVQPVAAVKHYGTDFMEAVRTRQFPKFAAGGPVAPNQWPFKVQMPPNAADVVKPYVGVPGTGGEQEYKGRVPRGLGAVARLSERMMSAVIGIHQRFPWAFVTSGRRYGRNAITVTGNKSYHGFGRATDWPASMELFNYFVEKFGRVAKEIIYSPAGHRQIWNGREHMYSGKVRATHFNHVHLALAQGGLVSPRKYDTGGVLPPGYTLAFNGTGKNETVRTERQEQALVTGPTRLDRRDLALLAHYVAQATGTPAITMDGRRVAETTNRYNYLPTGV